MHKFLRDMKMWLVENGTLIKEKTGRNTKTTFLPHSFLAEHRLKKTTKMQGYKKCKAREKTEPKQKMINSLHKRQKDAHLCF